MSDQRAAIDAAFRAHHAAVYRYVLRRVERSAVEDVVGETFLVAWRRHEQLAGDPLPWLLDIARRVCANHLRARSRRAALGARLAAQPAPAGAADAPGPDSAVLAALTNLRDADREAILLIAWDGLDNHQAANVLGCGVGAADPARGVSVDHEAGDALIERVLSVAIESTPARSGAGSPNGGGRVRRRGLLVLVVVLALLVAAAAALAAVGVIKLGAPAKSHFQLSQPRNGLGALRPGPARLLAVSAPDPAGGLPWGMREISTTRGVGCIEVGRVLHGRLGALGEDGAFHDDGRFHEFPARGLFDGAVCADLDANDRLFDTVGADVVPASADGESDPSLGIGAVLSLRHASARCPAADLRQLSYGLLGPDARSLTYTLAGHRHTLAPSGPEGAYLMVSTPPCGRRAQSTGASLMPLPWDSPVDTISYSNGTICNIARTQPGKGPEDKLSGQCKPPGYVPLGASAPTHAQVAAAIHATLVTVPPAQVSQLVSRRAIRVSFTARVAVTKAASAYELVESTSSPLAVFVETQKDIAVGQTVSWLLPAPRPGTYSGTVTLGIGVPPAYPIYSYSPGPLVGRFSIRVP